MALLQIKKENRYMIDEWVFVKSDSYENLYAEMIEEYPSQGFTIGSDVRILLTSEDKQFNEEKKLNGKFSS
jgi:hypothetical protein